MYYPVFVCARQNKTLHISTLEDQSSSLCVCQQVVSNRCHTMDSDIYHRNVSSLSLSPSPPPSKSSSPSSSSTSSSFDCNQSIITSTKFKVNHLKMKLNLFKLLLFRIFVVLVLTLITLSDHRHITNQQVVWGASGQCLPGMMTSFERITSVTVKGSPMVTLYSVLGGLVSTGGSNSLNDQSLSRPPIPMAVASQLMMNQRQQVPGSQTSATSNQAMAPITAECNNRCRRNTKCRAFLVDYDKHTCFGLEQPPPSGSGNNNNNVNQISSAPALARAPPPITLVPTQERTSYFEKVCLNIPVVACDRAWLFERVLSYQLVGYDDKIIDDVQSRIKCQELCLNERDFRCRSGEYDYITMQCRLSTANRHSRPESFRQAPSNVDYFENQCAPSGAICDTFDRFDNYDLGRAEIMRQAYTPEQCQTWCTNIKAFICRSFTFNTLTLSCYLNSDDSLTVGGLDRLLPIHGFIYYQRSDCLDLRLDCEPTAMTLQLRTEEPFRGRMYVKEDPLACETMGRSTLSSSLTIPFSAQSRCVTRDDRGKYTSTVVVQHHPMIQRKSDRYVKVVCDFQTSNRTISNSYSVLANLWASTALVNATSSAPQIRLRITDKYGSDITGAKLGDELYLRIEAETDSVFDMVARSVIAKSGTTEETITLIDKDGCPTDLRIFPSLRKLNKRTLIGKFDAFKFSSDVVVRFQVDVQFCLNQCPQVNCDQQPTSSSSLMTAFNNINNTEMSLDGDLGSGPSVPDLYIDQSSAKPHQQHLQDDQLMLLSDTSLPHSSTNATTSATVNETTINMAMSPSTLSTVTLVPNDPMNTLSLHGHHQHQHQHQHQQHQHQHHLQHPTIATTPTTTQNGIPFEGTNHVSNHQHQQHHLGLSNGGESVSLGLKAFDTSATTRAISQHQQQQQDNQQDDLSSNKIGQQNQQQISDNNNINGSRRKRRDTQWGARRTDHRAISQADTTRGGIGDKQFTTATINNGSPMLKTDYALHREIIVESGPSPIQTAALSANSRHHQHHSTDSAARSSFLASQMAKQSATNTFGNPSIDLERNGAGQELADNSHLSASLYRGDTSQLFCTTRYSLVLASAGFCLIQFLSVILCLGSWIWKRKRFQVKHHIDERLY